MSEFWPIASKVFGVLLVMMAGAASRRLGWLTSEADKSLASFTANVLLPALLFHRVLTDTNLDSLAQTWLPPVVGFAATSLGFLIAALTVRLFGGVLRMNDIGSRRAFVLCAGVANYGYIPIPLAEHFFPESVVTLMVHNVGVEIAIWSIGIIIISGGADSLIAAFPDAARSSPVTLQNSVRPWWYFLASPPLLAVLLALILRPLSANVWLPEPVLDLVRSLGQCAIPLGLILSGAIIYDHLRISVLLTHRRVLLTAALVRLLVLPLIMLCVAAVESCWFFPMSDSLRKVILLQAAMPAATFPIVLTRLYAADTATSLRVVVGTFAIGLITIPGWILLGRLWLHV